MVRVRMFAAVRDAAGTAETQVEAGPLASALEQLCRRHGELFRRRLAVSTVLVDGTAWDGVTPVEVADGSEIALLPPVSGGAGDRAGSRRRTPPASDLGFAAGLSAVVLLTAAAPAGGWWFAAAVVAAAVAALVALAAALGALGPRPILPAAAVAGLGVPIRAALDPDAGMQALSSIVAAMVLVAFVLAGARVGRPGLTTALGFTLTTGLVVALGAGGLVLLRAADRGLRWVLGLLVAMAAAEVAAFAAARARPGLATPARLVALGAVGGGMYAAFDPPFGPVVTVVAVGVVLAAGLVAELAERAWRMEGAGDAPAVRWVVAVGAAAPCIFLLATVTQR